jgi:hypothetical protein
MRRRGFFCVEVFNLDESEKYVPAQDKWVSTGAVPVRLVNSDMSEIGPAVLLPDGQTFFIGATGYTCIYTPPDGNPAQQGSWRQTASLVDANGTHLSAIFAPARPDRSFVPGGMLIKQRFGAAQSLEWEPAGSFSARRGGAEAPTGKREGVSQREASG